MASQSGAAKRSLRGSVKPPVGEVVGGDSRVLLTLGTSVIADVPVGADGTFDVQVPADDRLVLTIIGGDRRVVRRPLGPLQGDRVDLGDLELPVTEFAAGIAGQAWDVDEDRHVTGGKAILRRDRTGIATERLDADGGFSFELSETTPLTAGTYQVEVDVPGYARALQEVVVSADETSYRIGRVEVTRRRRG
jgi:hypothetical protein